MTDRAKAHRRALVPRVTKKARVADSFKSFSFNINEQNSDQGLNPEMVYTVDELVNTCPPLHRATASLCADVFGASQQLALEDAEGNLVDLHCLGKGRKVGPSGGPPSHGDQSAAPGVVSSGVEHGLHS